LLLVQPASAAAKPKWNSDGTLSYNGKTWIPSYLNSTDNSVEGFIPRGNNSACPPIIRFNGNYKTSKKASLAQRKENALAPGSCMDTKLTSLTVSNGYPTKSKSTVESKTAQANAATNALTNDDDSSLKACDSDKTFTADPAVCSPQCTDSNNCNLVQKYINPIINKFLAPLTLLAVIIGIIWGGIQYATSAGDSQKTAAAKGKIQNALLGLVAFILLYAFLNWLVPGGLV